MAIITCPNCGRQKEHKAKGFCGSCYNKFLGKSKIITCERCRRQMPHHSKGLCGGCFNFVYRLEKNKAWNYKRYHNIEPDLYEKITKSCIICGFDKVVELHHLNEDKTDNSEKNLLGLCPNHHKMIHEYRYRQEIFDELIKKGFEPPKDIKLNFLRAK